MSRVPESKDAVLYSKLSANQSAFAELLDSWRRNLAEQESILNNLAIAALVDTKQVPYAQVQLGRCRMLEELINYAELFTKS